MCFTRNSLLVLLLTLAVFYQAPAAAQVNSSAISAFHHKSHKTVDTLINLKPGETYALLLKSLPSEGYGWTFELLGDKESISANFAKQATPPAPDPNVPKFVGASVEQRFLVKGLCPGSVTIHLVERRPWEKDKPPADERNIRVTVKIQ